MKEKFEVIKNCVKFEGKFLKVFEDTLKLPNNKKSKFELVIKNDAVAIVPINKNGEVILVRQYRPAICQKTLEIPAGILEDGEKPEECALRELEEETSFKAGNLKFMFTIYPAVGFCNEKIQIYLATNLSQGKFNLDDNEFISIEKYMLEDAINLIYSEDITDSKTVAALFAVKNFININKIRI